MHMYRLDWPFTFCLADRARQAISRRCLLAWVDLRAGSEFIDIWEGRRPPGTVHGLFFLFIFPRRLVALRHHGTP